MTDLRNPLPSSVATSHTMKANRATGTGPEVIVRKALREAGYPGYRLNWRRAPGRPDITYPGRKVAIFVNGCFWHRCPRCNLPLPKTHADFWAAKFQRNVERDARKTAALEAEGWIVITVWECEINANLPAVVERIGKVLRSRSAHFL
ncbi:MAG: very short patch repair endonuclease [Methanomethylophilus sp.]